MKLAVVANPTARAGTGLRESLRALDRLRERAGELNVYSAAGVDVAAAEIAKLRDEKPDALVVVGGDGTVHMAANLLAGYGVPLAIIPAGTGNDFASANSIPNDPVAAADIVFDGKTEALDLGEVIHGDGTSSLFTTVLACGFDSKVGDRANQMRWPRGHSRYNLAIAIEFFKLAPLPLALSWIDENGEAGEEIGPLILSAISNTYCYGGGIPISPGADPKDGMLDVTIVSPTNRRRLVKVLLAAFKGKHVLFDEVATHRVREVTLTSPTLNAYADGDYLGNLPARVTARPGALLLRVPSVSAP